MSMALKFKISDNFLVEILGRDQTSHLQTQWMAKFGEQAHEKSRSFQKQLNPQKNRNRKRPNKLHRRHSSANKAGRVSVLRFAERRWNCT